MEDDIQRRQPPWKTTFIEDEFQQLDISLCFLEHLWVTQVELKTIFEFGKYGRRPKFLIARI